MTESGDDRRTRRVRRQLESLRANGIDWVPRRPVVARPAARPAEVDEASLFEAAAPPPPIQSVEQRRQALALLADEVKPCMRCAELCSTRTQTVFGIGRIDPDICIIGEAPGADEDRQGEPFVGAAGQLLNKIIAACGLTREEVYICNILKCRPPGNRTPRPDEAAHCREYLDRQLALVRPKSICCMGGTAAINLLGVSGSLGKLRGRFYDYRGIPVLCTYHPAYLLPHRAPEMKKEVWADMKMLLNKLGRPIPPSGGQK